MRVLVTGGAGFIGRHVVMRLLDEGHDVTVLDRKDAPDWCSTLDYVQADVAAKDVMSAVFKEVEPAAVVHLAAEASIALGDRDPERMIASNVTGTVNVVDGAKATNARLVFASSAAVYPEYRDREKPIHVGEVPRPATLYGWTKAWGEQYAVARQCGVLLRFSNVFGPGQYDSPESGVIGQWVHAFAVGEPLIVHGTGEQVRDFVPVDRVVDRIVAVLSSTRRIGKENVSTGRGRRLVDVLGDLARVAGPLRVEFREQAPTGVRWSVLEPTVLDEEVTDDEFRECLTRALLFEQTAVSPAGNS